MDNASFFVAQASYFVVDMWRITLLLVAVAAWGGIELWQGRRLRSWPFLAVLSGSFAVFLVLPAFSLRFWGASEGASAVLGVLNLGYLVLLAAAVGCAAGYRRPIAAVAARR